MYLDISPSVIISTGLLMYDNRRCNSYWYRIVVSLDLPSSIFAIMKSSKSSIQLSSITISSVFLTKSQSAKEICMISFNSPNCFSSKMSCAFLNTSIIFCSTIFPHTPLYSFGFQYGSSVFTGKAYQKYVRYTGKWVSGEKM